MLRSVLTAACLLSVLSCATAPATRPDAKSQAQTAAATPVACVRDTATRIPTKEGDCTGPGRAYSSDEIRQTGHTQAGKALQLLDPTVTVGH